MRWPRRQDHGRDRSSADRKPASRTNGTDVLETEIVARDRRGRVVATVRLDLASLQAEAESAAAGSGDPVRLMANSVVDRLAAAGAELHSSDRSVLEAALSDALIAGNWPATMNLKAPEARRVPAEARPTFARPEPATQSPQLNPAAPAPPASGQISGAPSLPTELFEKHLLYPSEDARRIYDNLVGLDAVKARLVKEAIVLTQPEQLRQWSTKHHGSTGVRALNAVRYGTPLLIFAGDVGTGKSALAESFGDAVARALGQPASLLRMSIQTRGSGIVGDMTRQISRAFRAAEGEARRTAHVTILLLDEADALTESRETQQMHHEDRAGVNALIQGVDHLRGAGVPALVVFCSNRLQSIDPAVRRRAVDVVEFRRPDAVQRRAHLERLLGDLRLTGAEWQALVELTGPREGRGYGFTYSDISDRLVRNAILAAFPDWPLAFALLKHVAEETVPTRPFGDAGP
ncbi:MAG: ATP-binding protein [Gemmatimonadaceae bacterium]